MNSYKISIEYNGLLDSIEWPGVTAREAVGNFLRCAGDPEGTGLDLVSVEILVELPRELWA